VSYFFNLCLATLLICKTSSAQNSTATVYTKPLGYISFVNPVASFDKNGVTYNFNKGYTIGFPTGINILKSDKIGFSFEITPFIKFSDSVSKVSNILFHPGIMFRYPKGFTLLTRLAFETSGRYGGTIVFNKIVYRGRMNNYFVAIPVPFRFGNNRVASVGVALQFGITF
jgi:hypothetical protein